MLQRYILCWLVASSGLAWVWPRLGIAVDPFTAAAGSLNALIVVTMFCVGALLPVKEVNDVFAKWPRVLAGTAIQYLSMPLLAWGVVSVLRPAPEIAAGILIVGCVPGAMASNVLTLAARGNVSYSVTLTTSATLLSPLVVPLALWLTLDDSMQYDGAAAVKLLLIQVVAPVVSGHLLNRFSTGFRAVAETWAPTVANLSILIIIAVVVAVKRDDLGRAGGLLLVALAVLNAGGYLAGYFGAAGLRFPEGMRRALTLEVGMQNAGAGIVLADRLFGAASDAVIPCALYTFGCMLTGTVLASIWQRKPPFENAEYPSGIRAVTEQETDSTPQM
ncbi:MAG: bile acid:sodium symporter family protein [Planctomycetaceae bacterium]|nr:bile acid:sodium symporter family protein [Planctomycetaceae bacterium]